MNSDDYERTTERTIDLRRMSTAERELLRQDEPDDGLRRLPLTRGECLEAERPCPFISCRHHLFLDVDQATGSIKLNFPGHFHGDGTPNLDQMHATCALDVADHDGKTLETVGGLLNVTRERVRQIEALALESLRKGLLRIGVTDFQPTDTCGIFDDLPADDA